MNVKLALARRCAAASLAVVALGSVVTAYGSSDGSSPVDGAHSDTVKSVAAKSASQQGGSGGAVARDLVPAGAEVSRDGVSSKAANASSSVAGSRRCHTGELRYEWDSAHGGRPDMDATYQQIALIRLTNSGGHTCTLHGYPGIRLIGKGGEAWDLPRAKDKPSTLTLRPGDDTAVVTFNLLPIPANTTDTRPLTPRKVLITPPDETTHVTLDWPYGGAIWHQAGKPTHPETFVNPIGVG
ncbi:DUF4232 domain-containing protein [Streptomyces sp. NA04227]|uniref:DUF4232 domain-containing protein n=1 Tax=Streptomyces sp. NA04227 TaxID=2742136 RepID=UPI0015923666|nr:DUF4232 domain-containing protein [Streptomyces sp. NA04227]QKW09718.1 DUF4232 domain-containing protein [Streptomyces sp. NA04227]